MREYPGTEETGQGGGECSRPAGAEVQYIQTSSCGVERHIVSGILRDLLSLSQETSSGVEIRSSLDRFSSVIPPPVGFMKARSARC